MAETSTQTLPSLLRRIREHFGEDPARLPVLEQRFEAYERPNLHMAIEELLAEENRLPDLVGIVVPEDYHSVTLSKLSREMSAAQFDEGPVEYVDVQLAGDRQLACVKRGLYCFRDAGGPAALLVSEQDYGPFSGIVVEVMAASRDRAEEFLRRLTRLTRYGRAFRGNVLSIEEDCYRRLTVHFHRLPQTRRDEIILPTELLERIERHTISFSRHADRLRAAKRHIKRGVLLYGPPGTGKTLSAMYLAAQMPGRTVLLITGTAVGAIERACKLARVLEPATVILEDVDLIGTQREHQTLNANALLFELLNQMDGLAEDADILFILTTNRPDIIEPALASRPGRIDQAIEIPPPNAECRRRLFELYARGMNLELSDFDGLVRRTEGVSGAFIRELLRKAAVFAAEDNAHAELTVGDSHIDQGLAELLIAGGPLTQSLLGATRATSSLPEDSTK